MKADDYLAERKANLARRLGAIERLMLHLDYSRQRLPYPLSGMEALGANDLESVSALIERFGKLQDMLAASLREACLLSGENATDMNDVLSRMEKLGILDSADDWRALRALRNLAAHEYDDDDARKTAFVNEIAAQSPRLIDAARRFCAYARQRFGLS